MPKTSSGSASRCPICSTATPGHWQDYPYYPFCSKRCKLIDLGRWLSEDYKISTPETDNDNRSTPSEPN